MTSIENRLPTFIPAIDELPSEEQFLVKHMDNLEQLYEPNIEIAQGFEKNKDVSKNAFLAHFFYNFIFISKQQGDKISEADQKFFTESLPRVEKIFKESEKGSKEYSRAVYLIASTVFFKAYFNPAQVIESEKEIAKTFFKLGVEVGYGPAMVNLGCMFRMEDPHNPKYLEEELELYQRAAKKGVYPAKDLIKGIEQGWFYDK